MREARFLTPRTREPNRTRTWPSSRSRPSSLVGPQLGPGPPCDGADPKKLPNKPVAYRVYTAAKDSPTHQLGVASGGHEVPPGRVPDALSQACRRHRLQRGARGRTARHEVTRGRIRNDTGVVAELVKDGIDALLTTNGAGSFADANTVNQI